jgi:hypothetical protein
MVAVCGASVSMIHQNTMYLIGMNRNPFFLCCLVQRVAGPSHDKRVGRTARGWLAMLHASIPLCLQLLCWHHARGRKRSGVYAPMEARQGVSIAAVLEAGGLQTTRCALSHPLWLGDALVRLHSCHLSGYLRGQHACEAAQMHAPDFGVKYRALQTERASRIEAQTVTSTGAFSGWRCWPCRAPDNCQ